ncbi:metal-dependent hydrolase family protein [Novosphingobium clariflavum]|uniref:Amidohydrolase family protein n=1 Tax=Novosphingobium clariflavum TaxID=2029884 RepID=A0ABV6SBK1_9SPHN|nr:amidohydrolase family protein [Novosphingobium clariflavum]
MNRKTLSSRATKLSCSLLALACVTCAIGTADAREVVIHAGRLIDGTGAAPRQNVSILITDQRITAIQPGFVTPAGADVVDLSDKTVLPGLIDTHDHITAGWHAGDPIRNSVTRTNYEDAIEATVFTRNTLLAGFTSVRDCGADTQVVVALKKSIEDGVVPGPRMWVAGTPLGPTGGHGDAVNGLRPEFADIPHVSDNVIDSPDAARLAVRRLKREGADFIKIMPSGGVMSIGDDPRHQLMTDDEIKAVIDTAHALGMKVAAHAHGKDAIDHTIALGVDSIEHGSYADAASYKLFKQHGAYLVPTMLVGERVYQRAREHPEQLNPSTAEKALTIAPLLRRNLHDAYAAGVRIAFGTDTFGLSSHGENAQEFALLVAAGMTPMDAIKTATGNAADLLGSADVGTLQAGRYADVIAVDGDPLSDVKVLEHVGFVMKGGAIVKSAGQPQI